MFDKQKQDCLGKVDKSNKQSIDKGIKRLVDILNKSRDYYTTSSCAGRIVLIAKKSYKKSEMRFVHSTHSKASFSKIKKDLLQAYPSGRVDGNVGKRSSSQYQGYPQGGRKGAVSGYIGSKSDIWLRQESFILHVCCRTQEAAAKLLNMARDLGIKRAGNGGDNRH